MNPVQTICSALPKSAGFGSYHIWPDLRSAEGVVAFSPNADRRVPKWGRTEDERSRLNSLGAEHIVAVQKQLRLKLVKTKDVPETQRSWIR
jgi:hypothetical protein